MIFYIVIPFLFLIQTPFLIADQAEKKEDHPTQAPVAAPVHVAYTLPAYTPTRLAPIKKSGAIQSKLNMAKKKVAAKKSTRNYKNKTHQTHHSKQTVSSRKENYQEQKKAHHRWPQKDGLIEKLEYAVEDIPERTKENRKEYQEKINLAFTAYKGLYKYNKSSKMFVTQEENHRVMQAVEKLFKHKHIENMVWHTNILQS